MEKYWSWGTAGIVLATAKFLQNTLYSVWVAGRDITRGEVEDIKTIQGDVLSESSVENCLETVSQSGLLAGLVYSVGITVPKRSIGEFDTQTWLNVVNTNVTGLLLVLKYAFTT